MLWTHQSVKMSRLFSVRGGTVYFISHVFFRSPNAKYISNYCVMYVIHNRRIPVISSNQLLFINLFIHLYKQPMNASNPNIKIYDWDILQAIENFKRLILLQYYAGSGLIGVRLLLRDYDPKRNCLIRNINMIEKLSK